MRAGQKGTSHNQCELLFHRDAQSVSARQSLRDQGCVPVRVASLDMDSYVPVREGPGRLPSALAKLRISNVPAEFMVPGATRVLPESAGYAVSDGTNDVYIRANFSGEQKPELALRFPYIFRLGFRV